MDFKVYRFEFGANHPDWPNAWVKVGGVSVADALKLAHDPAATQFKELADHLLGWSFDEPLSPEGVGQLDSGLGASLVAWWIEELLRPRPLTAAANRAAPINDMYPDLDVGMTAN